jgi:hypothetical protein
MAVSLAMSWSRSRADRAISASIPASRLRKQLHRALARASSCVVQFQQLSDGVQV